MTQNLKPRELAARIDHTLLKPEATPEQIDRVVAEAIEHGFASVCVNGVFVEGVARKLAGHPVRACAVAGFPLGAMTPMHKAIEASGLVKLGAREIDFVAHLPHLLACDLEAVREEFTQVVKNARAASREVIVKVIIESAVLMAGVSADQAEARIACAAKAARESGCDFIKTSTGFHGAGGATVEAVTLMKRHAHGLLVKASGGVRGYDDAIKMLAAGADRLGCSAGVAIVQGAQAGATGY